MIGLNGTARAAWSCCPAAERRSRPPGACGVRQAAKRDAWLLQAHPPTPTSPRWNVELSTDAALKKRTIARTAVATHPRPPTVPSPRLIQTPITPRTPRTPG